MTGATTGNVRLILRLEGACVLAAALVAYSQCGMGWGVFALFFLLPDISFLGYLANARVGAVCYNLTHSYIGAVGLVMIGVAFPAPHMLCAGIIWAAHIAFDRALGYGLKYAQGFGFTHLGLIGKYGRIEV